MSRLNVANFRHPDGTADNINLDSSSNVGIGTTSPSRPLHVVSSQISARFDSTSADSQLEFLDTTGTVVFGSASGNAIVQAGGSERVRIDSTGNLRFNSGYGSVATAYGARAWIRFDGSAATIGSGVGNGNMDAVTDNGTGDYTVNFTTDMPDANYAIVVTSANTGTTSSWTGGMKAHTLNQAAGSCRIIGHHGTDSGEARNTDNINVVVFR